MIGIALALSLHASPPPEPAPWRLVNVPGLHVGLRPYFYADPDTIEGGVTVRITMRMP